MNGFSVEPGERMRARHVDPAGAAGIEDNPPSRPRRGFRRSWRRPGPWRPRASGRASCAASRATASSPSCTRLLMRQLVARARTARCAARRRRRAAASAGSAMRGAGDVFERGALGLALAEQAGARPCASSTRSRAACGAGEVAVGPAALRQLRQRDEKGGLRDASAASAPCRNRRAMRRARLRDCRHRAPASDSVRGSRACVSRRSIWMARSICRIFAPKLRLSRGSISRASCIDSVEPPETMRPLPANWPAARSKRQHVDAVMIPEALVLIGDQHVHELRIDLRRGRSASRQRPSGVAKARSSAPSRSTTSVETGKLLRQRRRKGAVGAIRAPPRRAATANAAGTPRQIAMRKLAWRSAFDAPHGALTSIMPVAVRAENCGRYMSSTLAAGWA